MPNYSTQLFGILMNLLVLTTVSLRDILTKSTQAPELSITKETKCNKEASYLDIFISVKDEKFHTKIYGLIQLPPIYQKNQHMVYMHHASFALQGLVIISRTSLKGISDYAHLSSNKDTNMACCVDTQAVLIPNTNYY